MNVASKMKPTQSARGPCVEILSGPHGTTVSISHDTSIADGLRRYDPGGFRSAAVSNIIQTPLDTERIL
jgi:hypothetical protein